MNRKKKKNEEDFKNESSGKKCQIKKQFTLCLESQMELKCKEFDLWSKWAVEIFKYQPMLFGHNDGKAA